MLHQMKPLKTEDQSYTMSKWAQCQCSLDRGRQGQLEARTAAANFEARSFGILGMMKEMMNAGPSQFLMKPVLALLKVSETLFTC